MAVDYPITEIFQSVQFEGSNCGMPAHFVRLSHCNRTCSFCDTPVDRVWQTMTADYICGYLEAQNPVLKNVIITGGEPTIHDLSSLLNALRSRGYYIAMETNGDFLDRVYEKWSGMIDWVTVSPKAKLNSGLLALAANEVKYIIPDHVDIIDWSIPNIKLQPQWSDDSALKTCLKLLMNHPKARLSIQTHKYLDLP